MELLRFEWLPFLEINGKMDDEICPEKGKMYFLQLQGTELAQILSKESW